jgi:Ca2+-binding EF-hand superfamily protein
MPALGIELAHDEIDAVFDSFDADRSGTIEIGELNRVLRAGSAEVID